MKINPTNPYVQKFFNYDTEAWQEEIIKNNPNCVFHLIEIEKNNPTSQDEIDRALHS